MPVKKNVAAILTPEFIMRCSSRKGMTDSSYGTKGSTAAVRSLHTLMPFLSGFIFSSKKVFMLGKII